MKKIIESKLTLFNIYQDLLKNFSQNKVYKLISTFFLIDLHFVIKRLNF